MNTIYQSYLAVAYRIMATSTERTSTIHHHRETIDFDQIVWMSAQDMSNKTIREAIDSPRVSVVHELRLQ